LIRSTCEADDEVAVLTSTRSSAYDDGRGRDSPFNGDVQPLHFVSLRARFRVTPTPRARTFRIIAHVKGRGV
jgi:hypothetical protein